MQIINFVDTPIVNRYSCGQDFADTVRGSQNNWTTLGNLGDIDLVHHDIQKLKDPLNKHIESYTVKPLVQSPPLNDHNFVKFMRGDWTRGILLTILTKK